MKDAAKCDKRCEWQNSANQENVERILHFRVIPESMSGSGLLAYHVANDVLVSSTNWYTFLCANDVARYERTVGALIPMAFLVTDDHASCLTPVDYSLVV